MSKITILSFRVEIGLRNTFSTFRYDFSSTHAILTKEDPQAPALRCAAPGYYYAAYRGEIIFTFSQSKQIPGTNGLLSNQDVDIGIAKKALEAIFIGQSLINDKVIEKAVVLANNAENPYG